MTFEEYVSDSNTGQLANGALLTNTSNSASGPSTSAYVGLSALSLSPFSSAYASMPTFTTPTVTSGVSISFSLWFRCFNLANGHVFDFGNGSPSDNMILAFNSAGVLNPNTCQGSTQYQTFLTTIADGKWRHFVWSIQWQSGNTAIWYFYMNGVAAGSYSASQPFPSSLPRLYNYLGKSNWAGTLIDTCIQSTNSLLTYHAARCSIHRCIHECMYASQSYPSMR
jgi:hypothetical protein